MEPDLAQLRALAAVVDTGSFDAAAAALHVTPSAVSQRIKALEQSVGQVVVRRSRPARATEAGLVHLRLARQIQALVEQAAAEAPDDDAASSRVRVSLAVNADSLDTWVLPALAPLAGQVTFELHREDQSVTADLLRDGSVMAAITSDASPVQGCRSVPLGMMRYRPMAAPGFVDRWFPAGPGPGQLGRAPMVVFDRLDRLQDDYLRPRAPAAEPPRHHVPASRSFVDALVLGLGWGMLPDLQAREHLDAGRLVLLEPDASVDVALHWQQWALRTPGLDAVSAAIGAAAAGSLVRPAGLEPAT